MVAQIGQELDGEQAQRLALEKFIGPEAAYYLEAWANSSLPQVHIPGLLFGPLWLAYRKLYRELAIVIFLEALVVALATNQYSRFAVIELLATLPFSPFAVLMALVNVAAEGALNCTALVGASQAVIYLAIGLRGLSWYHGHCKAALKRLKRRNLSSNKAETWYRWSGGTERIVPTTVLTIWGLAWLLLMFRPNYM